LHVEFSEYERQDLLKRAWNVEIKRRWRQLQQENGTVRKAASQHEQHAEGARKWCRLQQESESLEGQLQEALNWRKNCDSDALTGTKWACCWRDRSKSLTV
jgi:hypothetical protein